MTVVTPTLRASAKKSLFWIIAAVVAVILAIVVLAVRGASGPEGMPLSATNPGPAGSMAVVEVLRQHGVTVEVAESLEAARATLGDETNATLFLHDADQILDAEQLRSVGGLAGHTVLVDPGFTQLRALAPSIAPAGVVTGTLDADCDVPAVVRAESVGAEGSGYRLVGDDTDAQLCLGSGDDVYSLIQTDGAGGMLTVLGTTSALSNEHVAELGNAALALTILGENDTLVWYQPTFADLSGEAEPTIGELTPAWLSLVMALLIIVFIAAGVWRGRRMGPLVVENLPVTVPSSETMEGRARLYQTASARLRALDSLRIGTLSRLATACGLPRTADTAEIAAVAASLTGRDPGQVRALLLDTTPATDRDLIALSDDLLTFERAVTDATTAETAPHRTPLNPPTQGE